jgi:AmmeMemoRadiSam system protein B/AmmeMemoRadiSam system protein A
MKKIIIAAILVLSVSTAQAAEVKKADLAGDWYPSSKWELESQIRKYLDDAKTEAMGRNAFAVISPHAGYRFSGPVAGYAYKAISDKKVNTVIIVGFSHRRPFDGIAVYDRGIVRTPIGDAAIDEKLAKELIASDPRISFNSSLFTAENSVELQIPFVQMVFPKAKIVPVAFGSQSFADASILAEALAKALKSRDDCLVVASTDLSHYHPYEEAVKADRHTISVIEKMKAKELYEEGELGLCELCGVMPVSAVLMAAEKLGFNKVSVLKYANSGDTFGNKENVVGYLSAVVYKEEGGGETAMAKETEKKTDARLLNDSQRKRLLEIARESIVSYVRDGKRKTFDEKDPVLNRPMGAFVTLHENGELRGCIGNMVGQGPLYKTVADMAIEAATGDPRFSPLSPSELSAIDIEISVLSPLKRVSSYKEITIPGNGVVVRSMFGSGVYLPQVATETGWTREEFLTSLCGQKAGISPDAWKDPATELYTFTAEVFGEKD